MTETGVFNAGTGPIKFASSASQDRGSKGNADMQQKGFRGFEPVFAFSMEGSVAHQRKQQGVRTSSQLRRVPDDLPGWVVDAMMQSAVAPGGKKYVDQGARLANAPDWGNPAAGQYVPPKGHTTSKPTRISTSDVGTSTCSCGGVFIRIPYSATACGFPSNIGPRRSQCRVLLHKRS